MAERVNDVGKIPGVEGVAFGTESSHPKSAKMRAASEGLVISGSGCSEVAEVTSCCSEWEGETDKMVDSK